MVTDGLDEVWSIEHYERNDDHPELNDRVCWTAYRAPDGRQVLEWANDEGRGCQVDVTGDMVAAALRLRELAAANAAPWPSVFMGPPARDTGLWDEFLQQLGLRRASQPRDK